jgi:phospholipase/lecithinase/hemolysin
MSRFKPFAAAVCLLFLSVSALGGTVATGDSLSDEYAFPIFFPAGGDRRTAENYVELLSRLRPGDFDFGAYSTTSRGTPRNEGFERNWARDAATSGELLSEGQHTGAAAQIASGDADLVFMTVGGNDARTVFTSANPPEALGNFVPDLLRNVGTAAGTILAASPTARLVIANVPDLRHLPELKGAIAAGLIPQAFADAVAGAIDAYNANLAASFAGNDRVAIADIAGVIDDVMAAPEYRFDGLLIERNVPGESLDHLFVDAVHPGTVGSALIANAFLDASNAKFGTDYERITTVVPLPAGAWAALAAAPVVALAARMGRRRKEAA